MKRTILNSLGINTTKDIPADDLFNPAISKENYGLEDSDIGRLKALKQFFHQYSAERPMRTSTAITTAKEAAGLMYDTLRDLDHEEVWAAFFNRANHVMDRRQFGIGGLDQTVIDTRRIIRTALELNASAIILYHNHPSGNATPSQNDIRKTEDLKSTCHLFDIDLMDHIIISNNEYYSFLDSTTDVLI